MRPINLRFGHVLRFHLRFSFVSTFLFPFISSLFLLFPVSTFHVSVSLFLLFPVSLLFGLVDSRGFRDIVEGDGLHGESENGLLHRPPGMRHAYVSSQRVQGLTVDVRAGDQLDVLVVNEIPRSVYSK